MTMKIVENTPNATFSWKLMPKAKMKSGRKIDFGMLNTKKMSGLHTAVANALSAISTVNAKPVGTARRKATPVSASVVATWLLKSASPRSFTSMAPTSVGGGRRRASTRPVVDATCQRAMTAPTMRALATGGGTRPPLARCVATAVISRS